MVEDLADEGMAEGVDTIARHTFAKERQPQAAIVPSALSAIPARSFFEICSTDTHTGCGTAGRRTSRF